LKLTGNWQHVVAKGEMSLVLGDGDDWGISGGTRMKFISFRTGQVHQVRFICHAKLNELHVKVVKSGQTFGRMSRWIDKLAG